MRASNLTTLITLPALLLSSTLYAGPTERNQAKRIFDRLTGTPPSAEVLDDMEDALEADDSGVSAAEIAVEDPAFYNVTLKNWVTPWTNEEQTVFAPLNDYTATVIGIVRDDVDFREVLFGDVLYTGNSSLDIDDYSHSNNNHYIELEQLGPEVGDLSDVGILVQTSQSAIPGGLPSAATAGVMTTRAASKAFYYLGTNRAMFRFTLMNHLCTDLEPIKDNTRSPDRVRQDVSRSPGGDSRIFLNSCVSCHAGMDGLAGAYAYYELEFNGDKDTDVDAFENSAQLVFEDGVVTGKHLINANNFITGYVTDDDSWINYWRVGQNELMGWNDDYPIEGLITIDPETGHASGSGAKSMGMELANSDAFAKCQVKKAFQAVCLRDPNDYQADREKAFGENGVPDSILANFIASDYQMKRVFVESAAYCKGD